MLQYSMVFVVALVGLLLLSMGIWMMIQCSLCVLCV